MNYPANILPRNLWGPVIQRALCLAKFKYYPDVHAKQWYDLGILLGHCRQWRSQPKIWGQICLL